ncbi:type IV pilus modification protein PilV [Xanthomonas theicola]|uniref:Type IV pilus modification protein PilV n=1 Tax=Xanthomonas theicola TaxID=56464 RepID=A0A2S6ZDE8_9XANT|nr:type IV pilus modification protein PilV [Xanthomonas theicola]PPT90294.1 type IV pilus modification protein PilV [Xanthomonas theicola]QNH25019.1 type IV pilus modification protein PilV [Xanthomonas theicola]
MRKFQDRRKMAGVTLIEVMISVLILGVGMLGVAAMQTTALRNNQSAMQRSQLIMQTYTILDAMRANRDVALVGGYNTPGLMCAAPQGDSLVNRDQAEWINGLKKALGDADTACGSIGCKVGECTVLVQWDDSRAKDLAGVAGQTQTIRTVTQL